jgi:hypothetical protein
MIVFLLDQQHQKCRSSNKCRTSFMHFKRQQLSPLLAHQQLTQPFTSTTFHPHTPISIPLYHNVIHLFIKSIPRPYTVVDWSPILSNATKHVSKTCSVHLQKIQLY